jgi:hypothetical protein
VLIRLHTVSGGGEKEQKIYKGEREREGQILQKKKTYIRRE